MTDYSSAWAEWEELARRRDQNPDSVLGEFLRTHGWIVERPETLSLPVNVTSSGGFTSLDAYRLAIHVRVTVGDRKYQVDTSIDAHHADMPARAFVGPVAIKIQRAIMHEIEPSITLGFEREISRAARGCG